MDALDLTQRPPRSPRLLLPGLDLLMIARTVDKVRASLPGGKLGEYRIDGFSSYLLKKLGIQEEALRAAVTRAASEEEVAEWVRENSDPAQYQTINLKFEGMKLGERFDDAEWMARYPLAKGLPPETSRVDFLVMDDKAMFES
jgi:Domain of unknown function (DUF5069)